MTSPPGQQPRLSINRGWAWYSGPVNQNRAHQHHAHQIAWSLDTELVAVGEHGAVRGPGYVVCSGAVHRVEHVAWLQTIYLAPEMKGAQWCAERAAGALAVLSLNDARSLSAILAECSEPNESAARAAVRPAPVTENSRLAIVVGHIESSLDKPLRANEVAKLVELSPSRFLHWFTDTLGLPFRAYVRWIRLQAAVRALSLGGNLTEAAYSAGFADSAHLSRTFASAFGITPNSLAQVAVTVTDMDFPMHHVVMALGTARDT